MTHVDLLLFDTPSTERQLALYQRILREGLSVRKVEALAQEDKTESKKPKKEDENQYAALEKELSQSTGLKVKIQGDKLIFRFENEEQLIQLANKLG